MSFVSALQHCRAFIAVGVVAAVAAACSSTNDAGAPIAAVPPGGVGVAPAPLTFTAPTFAVPANTESQKCYYSKAQSDVDLDIGHIQLDFSTGTHHVHLYWGTEDHADGVEDCFQSVDFDKWHLLVASQKEHLDWTMPPGVAIRVKAHQQLVMQVHFVNAGLLKADGDNGHGMIRLDPMVPGTAKQYMGSIFGQQRVIDIPPKGNYVADGICKLPHDMQMAALAGHYHFRGHDFTAYRMAADGADGPEFYQAASFGEPKFSMYQPGEQTFVKGQRILWRCNYTNDLDQEVSFGPREIDQEHCNMFAFFYPATEPQEFLPCVSWGRCSGTSVGSSCKSSETCNDQGECVPSASCAPKCDGLTCGDDGCGGTCGKCKDTEACSSGTCEISSCTPECSGRTCGDDGCGGSCGSCGTGNTCSQAGTCTKGCTPVCNGKNCGDDGCGGSCGSCTAGGVCSPTGTCGSTVCDSNGGKETDPNNTTSTSNALCSDGTIRGALSAGTDQDWFTFSVVAGDHYNVTLSGLTAAITFDVYHLSTTGSGTVSKLGTATAPGDIIGNRTYSAGTTVGGTYYARVYSPGSTATSPTSAYKLSVVTTH